MTEHEDLIVEARKAQRAVYLAVEKSVADDLSRIIGGLTHALEEVTAERDEAAGRLATIRRSEEVGGDLYDAWIDALQRAERAEAERDATRRSNAEITRSSNEKNDVIAALGAERDALAAVVEQVRATLEHYQGQKVDVAPIDILDMLPAPSVALDRVKAGAWDEGATAASEGCDLPDAAQIHNPYRKNKSND